MSDVYREDDDLRMRDHAVNRRSILLGGTSLAAQILDKLSQPRTN